MAARLVRALQITVGKRTSAERRWPCTISTEAEVVRRDKEGNEFIEILDHGPDSIDLSRGKLPVLEAHDTERVNIGVVENIHLEGRTLKGDLVLGSSKRADELAPDIDAGIVSGLSAGYVILPGGARRERRSGDGPPVVRVMKWQPYEVSLTGVPLDIDAGIGRAKGKSMDATTQQRSEGGASEAAPASTTATVTTTTAETREITCDDIDPEEDPELYMEYGCGENGGQPAGGEGRAASDGQAPAPAQSNRSRRSGDCGCKNADAGQARAQTRQLSAAQVRAAERKRIAAITRNVELAGLDRQFADDLVHRDLSVEAAGKMIFMALEKRDMANHPTGRRAAGDLSMGAERRDHFRAGLKNALGDRIGVDKLNDNGRQYRSLHTLEICKAALVEVGATRAAIEGMTRENVALAALGNREMMTRAGAISTSDLPYVFGDLANASLRQGYQAAPQTFKPIVRSVTLPDFKDRKLLQFSEGPQLLQVYEGGEYERGSVTDNKVTWHLSKYGRIFPVTWEAMLADNLDALSRMPSQFGQAAANKASDLVWAQLTGNPTMAYDSVALFNSAHGNYDASGAALANDKIAIGRKKIRLQTGIDGVTKLNLMPKYLIVPAALEFTALQLLAAVSATQASNVNLFAGQFQLIVEPRLDDADPDGWYLACDPGQIDTIEVGTLEGYGDGPTITTREAFDSDGMEIKARYVFGCKVVEHRGFYYSAGA